MEEKEGEDGGGQYLDHVEGGMAGKGIRNG